MAVSESDVRHVAALARLAIAPERLLSLVTQLNGILAHMEVLASVDADSQVSEVGRTTAPAIRSDVGGTPVPLAAPLESLAPEMRDGFFLVPRLATHEDEGDSAS
jgi:aspartyl-tRNA(Asn)/glutamyl-tRNA(Gln) amidotransferase subunit C